MARVQDWLTDSKSEADAERIVRGMYEHTGRFWGESLFVSRHLRESSWRRFVELQERRRWEAIAETRRGCLIATSYYGHPGVLACALGQIFRPLHVVADQIGDPTAAAWQHELYRARWVESLDRARAASELPRLLDRGAAVMIIAEAERATGRACPIRFLGRRIRAYPTLARLARSFDAPIIPAVCRRRAATFQFDIAMNGVVEAGPTAEEADVMGDVLARIETLIAEDPGQYLWTTPILADRGAVQPVGLSGAIEDECEQSRRSA